MIDALGEPQSLALLGGTSDIGAAVASALVARRVRHVVLAGRDADGLDDHAAALRNSGATNTRVVPMQATETATHQATIDDVFSQGDIDVIVLAFGVLGDQSAAETNPDRAVEVAAVNYVAAVSLGLRVATAMRKQGHGAIVILSSVAGIRARRSNYVYGSSKAGTDTFAQGLAESLRGSGVRVMIVRPGFVRTAMTAHLDDAPLAVDAIQVADAIVDALRSGRNIVWVPAQMRFVMWTLRHLPQPVFRRLPL